MNIGFNKDVGAVRSYSLQRKDGVAVTLTHTVKERDLCIILTPDFKFSAQSSRTASKANAILGMLKHTFMSRDVELWALLYRTYIRPHLEFANSAWSPFLRRDITVLEKVQRRATRLPKRLKEVEYGERLGGRAILQNSTYKRVHIGYFLDFFDEFFPSKNRGKKIF